MVQFFRLAHFGRQYLFVSLAASIFNQDNGIPVRYILAQRIEREKEWERHRDRHANRQKETTRNPFILLFFLPNFSLTLIIIASLLSLPLSFSLVKSKSKSIQNKKRADQKNASIQTLCALFPIKQKKLVQICESKSSPRPVWQKSNLESRKSNPLPSSACLLLK